MIILTIKLTETIYFGYQQRLYKNHNIKQGK